MGALDSGIISASWWSVHQALVSYRIVVVTQDPDSVSAPVEYRYEIDSDDRIRFVDSNWLEFARANGAEDLVPTRVLGASLWTFVSGSEALRTYGLLFERVRRTRGAQILPFRCDAPAVRRDMELTVRVLREGAIGLTGVLLRETPHARVAILDTWAPRSRRVALMCSWCKRTRIGNDWVDVEGADAVWADLEGGDPPRLIHGICPVCQALMVDA